MKKTLIALFVGLLAFTTLTGVKEAQAIPMGAAEHSGNYFLGAEDLGKWSIGAYYLDRERDINTLGHITSMQTTKGMAYVGYEILYGMSAFATVGSTETQFEGMNRTDTHSEYGLGLQFNILDHDIPDPGLMEDRIRLNGTLQYTQSGADWVATEIDWEEFYASLTLSIVNEVRGNKVFNLDNIGFFFGAVYSHLESSGIEETSSFGYTAGLSVRFSEKISFEMGVESLDQGAIFGGIHIGL